MNKPIQKYGLLLVKIVTAAAFIAAGLSKLAGAEMMIAVFDTVGLGQWFRYFTGAIEIAGAVALFVPGIQAYGAALLAVTMGGAVLAHILILGPSLVPALVLGILSALLAYAHRSQLTATWKVQREI